MTDPTILQRLAEDPEIPVTVRGQTYVLTQQSQATIERVLQVMYPETEEAENDPKTWADLARASGERWGTQFEALALMLGARYGTPEHAKTAEYLRENCSWPKCRAIFEQWYELNEIADFLQREGNVLLPQRVLDRLKDLTPEEREALRQAAEEQASSSAASPATPTSS